MRARIVGALIVALVTACTSAPPTSQSPSLPVAGSQPATQETARPTPTGPVEELANAVRQAPSDDARRDAILNVLAAVGIGVYTSSGQPLVRGAERSAEDFYAYDFEVDGLSLAIRDGDRVAVQDLASGLAEIGALGPVSDDAGAPAAQLSAALSGAVADAEAAPNDPSSTALLLAEAFASGDAEPVDLAKLSGHGDVTLDPLTGFLVAADFLLPSIAASQPGALADLHRTASLGGAIPGGPMAAGPCPATIQGQGGWSAGRAAGRLPGAGAPATSSTAYLQLLLANSIVEVSKEALPGGGLNWHYRHDVDDTEPRGYQLVFRLRITPSPGAILCGALAGTTLPQQRVLGGVPVDWQFDPFKAHGAADCPASGCATTDGHGASTFKFLPKLEADPVGIGPEVDVQGVIRAQWDVGRSLAPELAAVIGGATRASYGWAGKISYHRPYEVFIEVKSDIRIVEALDLFGHAASAHADGRLDADTVHAAGSATTGPPCSPPLCVGPVLTLSPINVKTTAATDGPQCPSPHVTITGPRTTIDLAVIEAVIYPAAELKVRLDAGFTDEHIDVYTFVPCGKAPSVVSPPSQSAWEHYMLRSRRGTGFLFEGLKASDADGPGWVYVADDSTWRNGGTVAIWDAPEGCGGSCDQANSRIRLEIKVVPLPLP